MMKIGFDAKRAFFNRSGLGNYSRNLLNSLQQYHPGNKYVLFTPRKEDLFNIHEGCFEVIKPGAVSFPSLWRSFGMVKDITRSGVNIFHGLSNELPFNFKSDKVRKIVTIHDLIYLRFPHLYPFADRKIYQLKFKNAAKNADVVIATSNQTKSDIINYLKIPEEKVEVVYQCCDSSFLNSKGNNEEEKVAVKLNLPSAFLLYVGTIEERKNLLNVIKALEQIRPDQQIPLVVIGKKTNYFKTIAAYIAANNLRDKILFPENVSNSEIAAIYRKATAFIYPSVFEGFGIPVLEAVLSNIPVITSSCSSLPEVAGPYGYLVDPAQHEEIFNAIAKILDNPLEAAENAKKNQEWALENFHPQKTAAELIKIYSRLI